MRILHLDSGREMRGGQWQVLRLHEGLIALGHESMLLAREGSPLLKEAARRSLPCSALKRWRVGLQAREFDIVHAHDARSHTLSAVLVRVPLVVSRRVAFSVKTSPASRWKYRRPVLFLAISQFVAGELRRVGVDGSRIAVVPDGVPVPQEPARGDAILIPQTSDPAKGMALAESAAVRAGIDFRLSTNLEADLPSAGALIYLSTSEGLGSGILLGMAYGVTVIASNTGGIPELIEDGVNGLLVPNEASAVAAALHRVDEKLGRRARQTVIDRFSVHHMVQGTLDAYKRALSC